MSKTISINIELTYDSVDNIDVKLKTQPELNLMDLIKGLTGLAQTHTEFFEKYIEQNNILSMEDAEKITIGDLSKTFDNG